MRSSAVLQQTEIRPYSLQKDASGSFAKLQKPKSAGELDRVDKSIRQCIKQEGINNLGLYETHFPERRPDYANPLYLIKSQSEVTLPSVLRVGSFVDSESKSPVSFDTVIKKTSDLTDVKETLNKDSIRGTLSCISCNCLSTSLKLLVCLHSVCTECLYRHSPPESSNPFQCPNCAIFTDKTSLITHTLGESIAELEKFCNSGLMCNECSNSDELQKCTACGQFRCLQCSSKHLKAFKNHNAVDATDFGSESSFVNSRHLQKAHCLIHRKPIDGFCARCDELVCENCKLPAHMRHPIHNLELASKPFQKKVEILKENVEETLKPHTNYNLLITDYEKDLENRVNELKRDINNHAQSLHKKIEDERTLLMEELDRTQQKEKSKLQTRRRCLKETKQTFETAINYVNVLLQYSNPIDVLNSRHQVCSRLENLSAVKPPTCVAKRTLYFNPTNSNEKLLGILDSYPVWPTIPISRGLNMGRMPNSTPTELKGAIEFVRELMCAVPHCDDTDPVIVAICVLDDNSGYLVVDNANKCIKLVSREGEVKQSIGRRGEFLLKDPRDVAVLPQGHVVVADQDRLAVFTRLGDHVMDIKPFFDVKAVTVNHQGQILALDGSSKIINVYSPVNGEFLYSIPDSARPKVVRIDETKTQSFGDEEVPTRLGVLLGISQPSKSAPCSPAINRKSYGQVSAVDSLSSTDSNCSEHNTILQNPKFIAVSNSNEVLVTDVASPHIKFFTMSGSYRRSEQATHLIGVLKKPAGICCDSDGYIIVADEGSHRVHLYRPDGKFLQYLVTKKDCIENPLAVATDLEGLLLISQRNGKIKVLSYS